MEDGSGSEAVRPRSFCAADYCRRRFWTHRKHLLALSRLISRLSLWQGLAESRLAVGRSTTRPIQRVTQRPLSPRYLPYAFRARG